MTARRVSAVLVIMLVALMGALGYQNHRLKNELGHERMTQSWPRVGDTVPITSARTLDGREVRLGDVAKGDTQALFFFSSKCGACIRSMPYIREIAASYGRLGIEIVGITPEPDSPALREFLVKHKVTFPVVASLPRRDARIMSLRATPTLLVINSQGDIQLAKVGSVESNKDAFDLVLGAQRKDVVASTQGGAK